MGRVYQSVREVVQGSLHRRTPDTTVPAPPTGDEDSLSGAVEELNKLVVDGIHRLKVAVVTIRL